MLADFPVCLSLQRVEKNSFLGPLNNQLSADTQNDCLQCVQNPVIGWLVQCPGDQKLNFQKAGRQMLYKAIIILDHENFDIVSTHFLCNLK